MNKQIRELAKQAGIPAIDGVWDYNDRNLLVKDGGEWREAVPSEIISVMIDSEKGLEKFAELIVRECCDWFEGSPSTDVVWLSPLTKSFIIANLKGHFGVEE